jgi:hypothetical protein
VKGAVTVHGLQRHSVVLDNRRSSIRAWQDRIRDPSLTVLLILEFCAIFLAAPLAAKGLPIARVVAQTLALAALGIVVLLSYNRGAIVAILLGLVAFAASALFAAGWLPIARSVLRRGGEIIAWSALICVVSSRGLCSWPHHPSAPPGRRRGVFERGFALRLGLWPDLGADA